jgi:hypothetical protein
MRTTIGLALLCTFSTALAQEAPQPQPPPPLIAPPPGYAYPPPQPGYSLNYMHPSPPLPVRYEMRPNYALLFSGVGVFALGYFMDVLGTLATSHQPAWECAVPVVGPWLQVNDSFSTDWRDLAKAFYVTDALIETAGFALTVVGVSLWKKVPVRSAHNGFVVTF